MPTSLSLFRYKCKMRVAWPRGLYIDENKLVLKVKKKLHGLGALCVCWCCSIQHRKIRERKRENANTRNNNMWSIFSIQYIYSKNQHSFSTFYNNSSCARSRVYYYDIYILNFLCTHTPRMAIQHTQRIIHTLNTISRINR